jgi:hypothetical protein
MNGNTYSATLCFIGHELALIIPKTYGAAQDQHNRILVKLLEDYGLKNIASFSELEQFLGATIYRITEKATAREVAAWGKS